jgi:hypothetical protein
MRTRSAHRHGGETDPIASVLRTDSAKSYGVALEGPESEEPEEAAPNIQPAMT